jgi:hypothetical protein
VGYLFIKLLLSCWVLKSMKSYSCLRIKGYWYIASLKIMFSEQDSHVVFKVMIACLLWYLKILIFYKHVSCLGYTTTIVKSKLPENLKSVQDSTAVFLALLHQKCSLERLFFVFFSNLHILFILDLLSLFSLSVNNFQLHY